MLLGKAVSLEVKQTEFLVLQFLQSCVFSVLVKPVFRVTASVLGRKDQ